MNNMRDRQGRFDRRPKKKRAKQIERVKGMGEGKSPSERKERIAKSTRRERQEPLVLHITQGRRQKGGKGKVCGIGGMDERGQP